MNLKAPFTPQDLQELDDRFLSRVHACVAMREIHAGNRAPDVIGLRHDCDAGHALATAVQMAEWEADRGYRSSYYILHTSPYWQAPGFREQLERIALYGHEIGIHTNALAEALRTGRDPDQILHEALATLRGYGHTVRGVAGHGDPFCNRDRAAGEITFANDEQFVECPRPREGEPDRTISRGAISLTLNPKPLAEFGLDYEALWLGVPNPWRISDSGGRWVHSDTEPTFDEATVEFDAMLATSHSERARLRQLHLLVHPDWWNQAFTGVLAAAAA